MVDIRQSTLGGAGTVQNKIKRRWVAILLVALTAVLTVLTGAAVNIATSGSLGPLEVYRPFAWWIVLGMAVLSVGVAVAVFATSDQATTDAPVTAPARASASDALPPAYHRAVPAAPFTGTAFEKIFSVSTVETVTAVDFSPDGKHLLAAKSPSFWSNGWAWVIYQVGKERALAGGLYTRFGSCVITDALLVVADGGLAVATASDDMTARLFRGVLTGPRLNWWSSGEPKTPPWRLTQVIRHTGRVNALATCHDRRRLLTASNDGEARLIEPGSGEIINVFRHTAAVTAGAVAPDGRRIVTGSLDRYLRFWDSTETAPTFTLPYPCAVAECAFPILRWSGASLLFACVHQVCVWDLSQPQPVCVALPAPSSAIRAAAFANDGTLVALGDADGRVLLRHLPFDVHHSQIMHQGPVTAISLSQDGKLLATGGEDRQTKVWSVQ